VTPVLVSSKEPIVLEIIVSNEFQADEEPGDDTRGLFLFFLLVVFVVFF
jgi:hypothetical protein